MGSCLISRRGGGGVNGTLPPQIKNFAVLSGNTKADLSWVLPADVTNYFGLRIVRKAGSAPLKPNDGVKIQVSNTATSYVDTGLVNGTTYYYRSFPYNEKKQFQTELTGAVAFGTPQDIPAVFRDATWEQINKASTTQTIPSTWLVGDTKDITLSTGEVLTMAIMGFNHDDLADGTGKAGITMGMKELMAAARAMNTKATNIGGFTGSAMYAWLRGTLLNSLPSDLKPVLKLVNKKTSAGNKSSTINTNAMKIFLFSEIEVYGVIGYSFAGEGSQYPYFTTDAKRIKKMSNGAGTAYFWWQRSPFTTTSATFCVVGTTGVTGGGGAATTKAVSFAFCV